MISKFGASQIYWMWPYMSRTDNDLTSIHVLTIDKPYGRLYLVLTVTSNVLIKSHLPTTSSNKACGSEEGMRSIIGNISLSCCFSSRWSCSLFSAHLLQSLFFRGSLIILNCHIGLRVTNSVWIQHQGFTTIRTRPLMCASMVAGFFKCLISDCLQNKQRVYSLGYRAWLGSIPWGIFQLWWRNHGSFPDACASLLFHEPVWSLPTLMTALESSRPIHLSTEKAFWFLNRVASLIGNCLGVGTDVCSEPDGRTTRVRFFRMAVLGSWNADPKPRGKRLQEHSAILNPRLERWWKVRLLRCILVILIHAMLICTQHGYYSL